MPLVDFGVVSEAIRLWPRIRFALLVISAIAFLLPIWAVLWNIYYLLYTPVGLATRCLGGFIISFTALHFIDRRLFIMLCGTFEYQYLLAVMLIFFVNGIYQATLEVDLFPQYSNYVLFQSINGVSILLCTMIIITSDAATSLSKTQKIFLLGFATLFGIIVLVKVRMSPDFFPPHEVCVAVWCSDTRSVFTSTLTTTTLFLAKYCISILLWPEQMVILKSKICVYSS